MASRVQVNYWAPETNSTGIANTTQAPQTPYTLVSDGYTYTSPSVYVVFKNLYAQGDCTYYEQGQIGNNISEATIAYDPDTLSTAPCVQSGESEFIGYEPINYSNWYNHIPNSVVETQEGCFIPNTHGIDPAGTDLAANPYFSLPQGLSSLQPIWSSYACQPNGRVPGFDPPRVLTKTSALVPGVQHPASQSATATPAAKLPPPIVTPTPASNAQPTLDAGTPDPKSVDADPNAGGPAPPSAKAEQHPTPTSQNVDPTENDPSTNLQTTKNSASGEVAGQPLLNSDPTNQDPGPGLSPNTGEDPPNASPVPAARPGPTPNQGFTVGSEVVTANSASQYVVSGQTITPGAPAVTISGTPISLDPSGSNVVIGTSTLPLQGPGPSALPSFTIGNEVITADSASHYAIAGQTITPGAPAITISSTPISLDPLGTNIVIGTSTIALHEPKPSVLPSFTVGDEVITADSASHYVVDGKTLAPGAPAITVSGTPISLAVSSAYVAVDSSTIPLQDGNALITPTVVVNGQVITANSASQFVVGGQTLTPGAPAVTIDGTPVSVPTDVLPSITVASKAYPYAVDAAGDIVIGSHTLVPGGAPVTLSGETISEAADRSDLVLASGGVATTEGLAQFIAGALGKAAVSTGGAGGNTSFAGQTFTGGASERLGMDSFGLAVAMAFLTAFVREAR